MGKKSQNEIDNILASIQNPVKKAVKKLSIFTECKICHVTTEETAERHHCTGCADEERRSSWLSSKRSRVIKE